ncbi:hypothetical protein AN641_02855 [Candidatus Epulonipiscioides gigas]|nr:hypothetical protein AN641_02855 [Epulopiscium sp. SCG-C07WGA-EpuloA2]
MLTIEKSKKLLAGMVTQPHLISHAQAVMVAMGGMAKHFGEDVAHWKAIGYLHDYDYEKYPTEHLQHTKQDLEQAGLSDEEIRAILSHGWTICSDVEPITNCEKSLFTVDELTGIISAAARMRPNGITDLKVSSFMKNFKDKRFAAKCDREIIKKGCDMLGMEVKEVAEICIEAMKESIEAIV